MDLKEAYNIKFDDINAENILLIDDGSILKLYFCREIIVTNIIIKSSYGFGSAFRIEMVENWIKFHKI